MRERVLAVALTVLAAVTIVIYCVVLTPSLGFLGVALLCLAEAVTVAFIYFIILAQMRRKSREKQP